MQEKKLDKTKVNLILIGIMISLLLSSMDTTVVSTAMKKIVQDLNGTEYYSWPFTIYMLCSTVSIPIFGGLGDILGRKVTLLIGILIFITSSMLCGTSGTMMQLIVYRAFQGVGAGIINALIFTIVADLFKPKERPKYMGIVTSVYGISSILGPLIGGFITDNFTWRWVFYVNVPASIVAFILIATVMPNFKSEGECKKSIDFPGIFTLIFALVPLLLALPQGGKDYSWYSYRIIGMFVFSAIMFCIFIFAESKVKFPLFYLSFLKNRTVSVSFAMAFITNFIMYTAIMFIPYFIQGVIGSTATISGGVTTPMMLGLLFTSNISGIIASKSGKFKTSSILSFIGMFIGMYLLSTMTVNTSYFKVVLFMTILGMGIGLNMVAATVSSQNAIAPRQISSVTSTLQFLRNIGSTIGSAVCGTIMTNSFNDGLKTVSMGKLPLKFQALVKNEQIIINSNAIKNIKAHVPHVYLNYVSTVFDKVKNVLSNSITSAFTFCVFAAILGFVVALFFRNPNMSKEKYTGKN